MNDLYRLGFLGNFLPAAQSYHWQHKGDSRLILADEWRMFIHFALHGALSIRPRNDRVIKKKIGVQIGDLIRAKLIDTNSSFAIVSFSKYGQKYEGQIYISEFKKLGYAYVSKITDVVNIGDEIDAIIKGYKEAYLRWELTIPNQEK